MASMSRATDQKKTPMTNTRPLSLDSTSLVSLSALGLALIAVSGCIVDSSGDLIGDTASASTCPIWACGTNSAEVNSIPIGELHQLPGKNYGIANAWGASLAGFIGPNGETDYVLDMRHGRLVARKGNTTLTGPGLVDSIIEIEGEDGTVVNVRIDRFRQVQSWTVPAFYVNEYVFTYDDGMVGFDQPICTDAEDASMDSAWAVISSAERYSWETKEVMATGAAGMGWNTIACSGNSLYKMKMTGYEADQQINNNLASTDEERQATLKMFTADYCGTGRSFTEDGTELRWFNASGWADNSGDVPSTFESYWNHTGALCLDTARLGASVIQDIVDECATVDKVLPPCSEYAGAYNWATEVPL